MPDEHTTSTSSRLDALEAELAKADPADAPAIAEEIAGILSDSLDETEAGSRLDRGQGSSAPRPETMGESQL